MRGVCKALLLFHLARGFFFIMAFPRVTAAAKVVTLLLAIVAVDYVLQEYKVREVRAVVRQTKALAEQVTYVDNQQHQLEAEITHNKDTIAAFEKQKSSLKLVAEHVQKMQATAQTDTSSSHNKSNQPARRAPVCKHGSQWIVN